MFSRIFALTMCMTVILFEGTVAAERCDAAEAVPASPLEVTIEPTQAKVFEGEPLLVVVKARNRANRELETDRGCILTLRFLAAGATGDYKALPKQMDDFRIGTAHHAYAVAPWPIGERNLLVWPGLFQRSWDEIVFLPDMHVVGAKVRLKAVCDVAFEGKREAIEVVSNEVSIEVLKTDVRAERHRDQLLQSDRELFRYKKPPVEFLETVGKPLEEKEEHRFCDWGRMMLIARTINGTEREAGRQEDVDRAIRLYSRMSPEHLDLRIRAGFRMMTFLSVHKPEHQDAIDSFLKDLHDLRAFIPETTILWRVWYNSERYFSRLYMLELRASREPRLFDRLRIVGGAKSKNSDLIRQVEEQTGYSLTAPEAYGAKLAECPEGGFEITLDEWFLNQAGHRVYWVKTGAGYECRPEPKLSLIRPTLQEGMLGGKQ